MGVWTPVDCLDSLVTRRYFGQIFCGYEVSLNRPALWIGMMTSTWSLALLVEVIFLGRIPNG